MNKLVNSKELNPFDYLDILTHIDNIRINKLLLKINNHTAKLEGFLNTYIIHKSTKWTDKIQCSIFYKDEPMSDIVRNNYRDIIKELPFNSIKILEVI